MSVQLHPDIEQLDRSSLCYSIYSQLYHNFFNAQQKKDDEHPYGVEEGDETSVVEATLTIGNHSILRAHNELIRKSILANNVGDLGGGTYSIDDTGFAIRRYGIVDIVFTFNYTKID